MRRGWMIGTLLALAIAPAQAQVWARMDVMAMNPAWRPGSHVPVLIPYPKVGHINKDSITPDGRVIPHAAQLVALVTWSDGTKTVEAAEKEPVRAGGLMLLVPPDGAVVGVSLRNAPAVQILTPEGLPTGTGPGKAITVAVSSRGAKLGGTLTVLTDAHGIARFPNLILLDTARTVLTFYVPATFTVRAVTSRPIQVRAVSPNRRG